MLRLVLAIALLAPLVGAGCATAQAPSDPALAEATERFDLSPEQEATVGAHTVRFAEVVEYSLCPPDVTCVSPGVARIRVEIDGASFALTAPGGLTREGDTDTANANGLAVTVTDIGPSPDDPDTIRARFVARER